MKIKVLGICAIAMTISTSNYTMQQKEIRPLPQLTSQLLVLLEKPTSLNQGEINLALELIKQIRTHSLSKGFVSTEQLQEKMVSDALRNEKVFSSNHASHNSRSPSPLIKTDD